MDSVREYVICVLAAAMVCGIVLSLGGNGATKQILKLVCGLFLVFAMVRPVTDLAVGNFRDLGIREEAARASEAGEEMARQALSERIRQESEAYILDKARDLDLELTVRVEVTTGKNPVPYEITVTGQLPPYMKGLLSRIIETDLGIPRESQTWTS